MHVYGKKTLIEEFMLRDRFHVQIYGADKGAIHCKVTHEFNETACAACGAPIKAEHVFIPAINGAMFEGIDCASLDELRAMVVEYVNELADADGGSGGDAEKTVALTHRDVIRPPPPLPPNASSDEEGEIGRDDYEDTEAPDPNDPPGSLAICRMRQLGWREKVIALFDKYKIK